MILARITFGLLLLASVAPVSFADDFFEKKIRPVLVEKCYGCHSVEADKKDKLKGGLLLDSKAGWEAGGDAGAAIVPGKPTEGTLLKAMKFDGGVRMPPNGKLSDEVVKDFETWIANGAADPRTAEEKKAIKPGIDIEAGKQFWAFQPVRKHANPTAESNPIDGFVAAKLRENGLTASPPADPRTLIRRVTFDLTGLPPTPEEVEAFVRDPSQTAFAKVVAKLLASPAYGERWARLWLDVARYAEDQAHIVGNDASLTYPNAYLYRDWVIQAFNADLPYDEFVKLQLAADLIEGESSPNLVALGFIGLGPKYYDRGKLFVMADEWEDRVDVVGRGLLGLTLACARCHDHKFDPIRTEDYYGLAGVFASTRMFNRPLTDKVEKKESKDKKPTDEAKLPKDAMHVVREGTPNDLTVFVRGDVNNKGPVAKRHFPPVLSVTASSFAEGSGRKELAEAVASGKNPLTARVIVNRVWAAYFGRGIVGTPSNFGSLGDRPTHPELLDDLAARFVANGWSLKWLHREIVTSKTYQQSSALKPADPDNKYLARMPRRRLSAEAWRDAVLAVTGKLDAAKVGGPSIDPLDVKETRRTVYSRVSRLELNRYLAMFDFPDPNVTSDKRSETTTPLQKLFVMNSPFIVSQADALAARLLKDVPDETSLGTTKRVERAYRLVYGRPPTAAETALAEKFLVGDRSARWKQYTQVLLAGNELLYLD
jgi:hypothetical protein